ncbi:hypothetical protein SAMN04488556_3822 [Halostagnicola kamekurae]|uniref:Uncharacterized protein n=1 Tax=Halostagnicola kamekurae TaxID=619731 RepID=A0A1I6UFG3_9EURY|nr:hypothetical protein SAMN04488556_3822 [Halostagnicola kamekurae]
MGPITAGWVFDRRLERDLGPETSRFHSAARFRTRVAYAEVEFTLAMAPKIGPFPITTNIGCAFVV